MLELKNELPEQTEFTKEQVCVMLGVSIGTINRLLKTGKLNYRKIGNAVRIPAASLSMFKKTLPTGERVLDINELKDVI